MNLIQEHEYMVHMYQACEGYGAIRAHLYAIVDTMRYAVGEIGCRIYGHDIYMDDISNGDSATEIHYCARCGRTWGHTYF